MASLQCPQPLAAPKSTSPIPFLPSARSFESHRSKWDKSLHLTQVSHLKPLKIELLHHHASDRKQYDMVVIGGGPAGLRMAERASARGLDVCCIDPSPLAMWPNNYGSWVDEFELLGLGDCLDKTWPMTLVIINERRKKYLGRPYGRVGRRELKTKLMESCLSNGVRFYEAKAWKVIHEEFKSMVQCGDGCEVKASLVVDASGFSTTLLDFPSHPQQQRRGFQIAHGVLAEVKEHPFDLDKMLLMDWRDSHLEHEPDLRPANLLHPTFLYAMPLSPHLIFLEETSLVSRPHLSYSLIKSRMAARLRSLGIVIKDIVEAEKCLIPMGGPLPYVPQRVVGAGAAAGLVHPATGYSIARSLEVAEEAAGAAVEGLGLERMVRGKKLSEWVWGRVWPVHRRTEREFYCFGMETLLKIDLEGTRRFFDAFFELDPYYWHGFLSSRLSLGELGMLSVALFGKASAMSKLDIVTKCPLPLAKMVGRLAKESV